MAKASDDAIVLKDNPFKPRGQSLRDSFELETSDNELGVPCEFQQQGLKAVAASR
jgi:hypothetical protein